MNQTASSEPLPALPSEAAPVAPPTFDALPLTPEVRRAIDEIGWLHPTPVQLAAWEPALKSQDLMVQARTGTGKTAAFALPLVDRRVKNEPVVQALILAPTRELSLQSAREFERLGKYRGIRTTAIYGGASMEKQVRELEEGAQVVSGTPGRVLDHLKRGTLKVENLRTLILDEADEMLSMGFAKELNAIVELLPSTRQTWLFSATLDDQVQRMANRILKDPASISLSSDAVGAQTLKHFVYVITGGTKSRELVRILEVENPESAIIFCNTKVATEEVAKELQAAGYDADWLNGDLPQNERESVLARTRSSQLRYLVATDVAARGIDISHLTHVVNYDFPDANESYVHRTGRTGRAGRTGTAISLIAPTDLGQLYYLRLQYKIFPIEKSLPSAGELKTRQELDRIDLLAQAFGASLAVGNTVPEGDRAIARRILAHDDGERIVAGLVRAFLGAQGTTDADANEQAAAARRAKPPRPVVERSTEERPRRSERGDRGPRPERSERRDRPERADRPERDRPERIERSDRPERGDRPERSERVEPIATVALEESVDLSERVTASDLPAVEDGDRPRRRRRRDREAPIGEIVEGTNPGIERQPADGALLPEGDAVAERPRFRSEGRGFDRDRGGEGRREERPLQFEPDDAYANLFVSIGKRDNVRVVDLLRLFETHAGLRKEQLGRIRIRDRHSFVAVPKDLATDTIGKLVGLDYQGRALAVEVAKAERSESDASAGPTEKAPSETGNESGPA